MGLQHPSDAQASAQIGAPVANPAQTQPTRVAVPANVAPVGSARDTYAYNAPGPGNAPTGTLGAGAPGGQFVTPGIPRTQPVGVVPSPLDPTQQANRRANLRASMQPYMGAAIS